MKLYRELVAAMLIVSPAVASAQDAAKIGGKQKLWMAANFRTGLTCSATPGGSAVSFSGQASFDASDDGGVDLAVSAGSGSLPVVTAVAINTKGTGADKGRTVPQACPVGDAAATNSAAACRVWGDPHEASVSFTVPVAALGELGKSKELTGHVTLIKRSPDLSARALAGKKGYDYYQAQSLTVLATCDSSGVTAKGSRPAGSGYDLVMGKKA